MLSNDLFMNMLNNPVRELRARVELHNGSTLSQVCGCHDNLRSFTIERIGANKFFGYGICHKLNVKLIDTKREINVSTANYLEAAVGVGNNYIYAFPNFYVSEVHRDENTNELSITAYDILYSASKHTASELSEYDLNSIEAYAEACGAVLGVPVMYDYAAYNDFKTVYPDGANFDGSETLREVLDDIAEATQTIYFIDSEWRLVFKRLDLSGEPVFTIDREKYFTLDSGENRRLGTIISANELGDNVSASTTASGSIQYVRDNGFWELRDDIGALVEKAVAAVGGLTINQFTCGWRGNILLEVGDKIALKTKDGGQVISYLLHDTLSFDGSLTQETEWSFGDEESENISNPTSLGEALKQTYAKVDKVNKRIDLVASDVKQDKENISSLQVSTNGINASVSKIETTLTDSVDGINESIATLTAEVATKISADEVSILIQKELQSGVNSVTTTTGFTFDEIGLTVEKSSSQMKTQITEDGMKVFRDDTEVLTANNVGVNAANLHATTYLIIGTNSRFEDYAGNRTGCFWVGG